MAQRKISDDEIKDCLDRKMSVEEIAEKFRVKPYSVILKIKKIAKESDDTADGQKRKYTSKRGMPFNESPEAIVPPPIKFDLRVGDIVTAYETEVSKYRRDYKVIKILKDIYLCRRLVKNGWITAFRKQDYKQIHDGGQVRLKTRRAKHEKQKQD